MKSHEEFELSEERRREIFIDLSFLDPSPAARRKPSRLRSRKLWMAIVSAVVASVLPVDSFTALTLFFLTVGIPALFSSYPANNTGPR